MGWKPTGSGGVRVEKAGTVVGTRGGINFIEGSNVTLTVADDAGNDEVDVTVDAAAGGTSADDSHIWRPVLDDAGAILLDDSGAAVMGYGPA